MYKILSILCSSMLLIASTIYSTHAIEPSIKVLIVDGQNNHNWKATTPVLKAHLEQTKLFTVDVATSPAKGSEGFAPKFSDYDVVVMNYNGDDWSKETQKGFESFVENGGGLVIYHAADNSFPSWKAYNEMIGLGGWGGRNEKDGPYIRYRDGQVVRDETPGGGGSHGAQHAYVVEHIDIDHPITQGLPSKWRHASDELYDRLRGPAKNLHVLAVAYSDKKTGGTGENEPVLFTIEYGKGRVFHTVMGHDVSQIQCVGFAVTFQRGTEWAATGNVTQALPKAFPTEESVISIK
jgi:type 1 glutamine amidotransferase